MFLPSTIYKWLLSVKSCLGWFKSHCLSNFVSNPLIPIEQYCLIFNLVPLYFRTNITQAIRKEQLYENDAKAKTLPSCFNQCINNQSHDCGVRQMQYFPLYWWAWDANDQASFPFNDVTNTSNSGRRRAMPLGSLHCFIHSFHSVFFDSTLNQICLTIEQTTIFVCHYGRSRREKILGSVVELL